VVWTDPPASPAAGLILVNNIDLLLTGVSGLEYRSNFGEELDTVNNVEQIVLSGINLGPGFYSVLIHGTYLPMGAQPYALVITGDFNTTTESCTDACPFNCGNTNGQCINGLCLCNEGYYGPDCSLSWCPKGCSGNGICMKEGRCICQNDWTGTDCSTKVNSDSSQSEGILGGVTLGEIIGISVAVFFFGVLVAFPVGMCVTFRFLRKKAIKKKRETIMLMMPPEAPMGGSSNYKITPRHKGGSVLALINSYSNRNSTSSVASDL